jgi:hypothetical protein
MWKLLFSNNKVSLQIIIIIIIIVVVVIIIKCETHLHAFRW